MTRYIIRRLLQAIPTLFGVSIISFVLVTFVPGDPVLIRTFDPKIKPEARETLRRQLGLDQSPVIQYVRWLTGVSLRPGDVVAEFSNEKTSCRHIRLIDWTLCDTGGGILRGDLGTSFDTKQSVWDRLVERMPATLELGIASLLLALLIGVPLGVLSAVYRGSIFDNIVRLLAVIFDAVPSFWLAILLIVLFSVVLNILPSGGRQTVTISQEFDLGDRVLHLILPAFVLATGGIAGFSRIMRAETLEVLHTDYIRTAHAKGLAPNHIWFLHALRNALIPLMTILGPAILGVLGGAIIVERIFSWTGMGRLVFNAALQRDFPVVLGAGIFFAVLTIVGHLLSDILYGVVDPRVRLS